MIKKIALLMLVALELKPSQPEDHVVMGQVVRDQAAMENLIVQELLMLELLREKQINKELREIVQNKNSELYSLKAKKTCCNCCDCTTQNPMFLCCMCCVVYMGFSWFDGKVNKEYSAFHRKSK